jgi:hypothetical protein
MSGPFVFQAGMGVGRKMDASDSRIAWGEMFGSEGTLFYDAEGNERTDRFRALLERVDQTTRLAEGLAERVAVLERLAVQDEARIALEIERTSHIERLCSERRI